MPIIAFNSNGRPRLIKRMEQISSMTMPNLIALEHYLWACMDPKDGAPTPFVVDCLNAIHREVEWRAQDPEFK